MNVVVEVSEWLVGEGRGPELPGVVTCRTRQALLDICSHPEPAVTLEALRLFEVPMLLELLNDNPLVKPR